MQNRDYFRGQGKIFARRVKDGIPLEGFQPLGDASKLELTVAQEYDDINENETGKSLTSAHIPIKTTTSLTMDLQEWSQANLLRWLYGASSGPVAGATVTGEAVIAYAGGSAPLLHPGVSSVVVKKGATTLVAGTDYTVNAKFGRLEFVPGSTEITGDESVDLTVDYAFAGHKGEIKALVNQPADMEIRFEGVNTANNSAPVIVSVYRCVFDLPASMAFIDSKHSTLSLKGMMLQDASRDEEDGQFFSVLVV